MTIMVTFALSLRLRRWMVSSPYLQLEWLPFLQFDGHILLSAKYITNDWTEYEQWHNVTASGSTQQELGSYLSSRNRSKSLKHLTSVNIVGSRADQWDSDLSWKSHWSDWSSYIWWPSQPLTWPSASFLCPSIFLINISSIFLTDVLQISLLRLKNLSEVNCSVLFAAVRPVRLKSLAKL